MAAAMNRVHLIVLVALPLHILCGGLRAEAIRPNPRDLEARGAMKSILLWKSMTAMMKFCWMMQKILPQEDALILTLLAWH